MKRREQEQNGYNYEENGITQVSQQIMDSYNSGVVGQDRLTSEKEEEME